MARHFDGEEQPGRNWGLLVILVLCVEVWIGIAQAVAGHV
jgi:hypothetical protein